MVSWHQYTTNDVFHGRVLAGLAIGAYGLWLGNGLAIPQPLGWWVEVPGLCICAFTSGVILVDPPEKTTSIRKVLLQGHPDPDHADNQLPGVQETLCHVLGHIMTILAAVLVAMRIMYAYRHMKEKVKKM